MKTTAKFDIDKDTTPKERSRISILLSILCILCFAVHHVSLCTSLRQVFSTCAQNVCTKWNANLPEA